MQLIADVGGTKILFGLLQGRKDRDAPEIVKKQLIAVREVSDFNEALGIFLQTLTQEEMSSLSRIVIGAAGPTEVDRATITNLDWEIKARDVQMFVRKRFSLDVAVYCYNDMVLQALGCMHADAQWKKLLFNDVRLNVRAPVSVLAVGTGLGEGYAVPIDDHWRAFGSEGGHATFGIIGSEDVAFLEFLTQKYGGHVSWERVVSGIDGFRNLWEFSRQKGEFKDLKLPEIHDKYGPALSLRSQEGCPAARFVMQKMAFFLGMEASNHALKIFSKGGLFLSGTVAQALLPEFKESFYEGFLLKGRFKELLQRIPVYLVTDPYVTLTGGFFCR